MGTLGGETWGRPGGASSSRVDPDEVDHEPPVNVGQQERRLQVRAYNFWTSLLGDRALPAFADIGAPESRDFAPYSIILDFSGDTDDAAITFLGERIAEQCAGAARIERLSDVPVQSLLACIAERCPQIRNSGAPIGFEAEHVSPGGNAYLSRGILLPFAGDDGAIDHVWGALNWKEVADASITAALHQEFGRAIADSPPPSLEATLLTDWADGPVTADAAEAGPTEANEADTRSPRSDDPQTILDLVSEAREHAAAAQIAEDRAREQLHQALGLAHDLALAFDAALDRQALGDAIEYAGLGLPVRSPQSAALRLVFGDQPGTSRLAALGTILAHAGRLDLGPGALRCYLDAAPGGIEAVAAAARRSALTR